ncbi:uncharacterized protein F4812DRAFT_273109 [Daldinia caldariorum]|uniref:uncharacterized protein n=1 Tax=Daldinia caldariorum TaxID=326644 RepID=UPI002008D566|nr:uncharacterized protein F4812DRAFT_273109 [Daldinia caldariorum]KAI1470639.1 hypothetical protein F4812DRAFT_273109 [Daldinia caldariorum]
MLFVISTLLCVVVSLSRGLELVRDRDVFRPGRFYKRIPSYNGSVTVVVTSSFDILASSLTVSSSETRESSIDVNLITPIDASTSDASSGIVEPSEDGSSTESYPEWTLFNLGTITTIGRPTLILPTSSLSRGSPVVSPPPAFSSSSSTKNEISFPTLTSSFEFNGTSRPWGWNTTSSAPSLILPTVTLPQPTAISTTSTITATPSECPAKESGPITITSYSIVHTSTTTWTGDPDDYTPPYPPISTPVPCTPKESPTGRFTITLCDSAGKSCSLIHTTVPPGTVTPTDPAEPISTVVLITTDKNPVVVFPTQVPPSYGGSPSGPDVHDTATKGSSSHAITPDYGMDPTPIESAKASPAPTPTPTPNGGNNGEGRAPVTVIVQPSKVVIDDHTFTDSPSQPTSTVVVGGETFVINPSQVVGGGVTMTRPPIDVGGGFTTQPQPPPITTSIGGLGVVLGPSSVATIGGTVFTIAPTPTVAVVQGQTITLGPAGLVFPSQTLHVAAGPAGPGPTQTAVLGGLLITAIGSDTVVISGSTITYGPSAFGSSTLTTTVDGDTVLVAATEGVVLHDGQETLGGITAAPDSTKYEIVGGATVTQLGLTAIEISGRTFRIGPGAAATPMTTVIAGRTLTIGPDGVGMSTWTLNAPYASTTTIFPGGHRNGGNGNNAAMTVPTTTATAGKDDSRGALLRRPDRARVLLFSLGVGCLGPWLFWL